MSKTFWALASFLVFTASAPAWDYEGHRMVNQLGLASLPTNFPAFARTAAAQERIAFLAGEADRWRNSPDSAFKHFHTPDHYLDLEDLGPAGIDPKSVTPFRFEFTAQLTAARAAQPTNFPAIDPAKNTDKTRELAGFLPWTITEYYSKLKSSFSYLKTFEEHGGTPEEIANAQQNVLYTMGVMGHFVGDASQPLHTTKHHHGWVGPNPDRYTTNYLFHAWIDGGFIARAEIKLADLKAQMRPAQVIDFALTPAGRARQEEVFPVVMDYILGQHKLVEPLYKLDKERKLSHDGEVQPEGRQFITRQLTAAGQMLGDLWLTAWQHAQRDTFLEAQLAKRNKSAGTATGEKPVGVRQPGPQN